MEVIKNNKGAETLTYQGYEYTQHSTSKNGDKIYWRCTERKICNARLHTNSDLENLTLLKDANHINHLPNHRMIQAKKIMNGVKRTAQEHPNEPPQQVGTSRGWYFFYCFNFL